MHFISVLIYSPALLMISVIRVGLLILAQQPWACRARISAGMPAKVGGVPTIERTCGISGVDTAWKY